MTELKEEILGLAASKKVTEFTRANLFREGEVATKIAEVVTGLPYVGSLVKFGDLLTLIPFRKDFNVSWQGRHQRLASPRR